MGHTSVIGQDSFEDDYNSNSSLEKSLSSDSPPDRNVCHHSSVFNLLNGVESSKTAKENPIVSNEPTPHLTVAASLREIDLDEQSDIAVDPIYWKGVIRNDNPDCSLPDFLVMALIDHGSSVVLIWADVARQARLRILPLHSSIAPDNAFSEQALDAPPLTLNTYCNIILRDPSNYWTAKCCHAVISPSLCADIIIDMPFIKQNELLVDVNELFVIHKPSSFDLLHPCAPPSTPLPALKFKEKLRRTASDFKSLVAQLKDHSSKIVAKVQAAHGPIETTDMDRVPVASALRSHIKDLAFLSHCKTHTAKLKDEYKDIFEPLPPVHDMPGDVLCKIKLKEAHTMLSKHSYPLPQKYRDAWKTLIQQHLDAGHIRPSSSSFASLHSWF
ncbi:hypothetical protein V5O48_016425 [Marasmius crinis-equi]|uniref:Uncharacterized protein n=1 Tax=Marasmius crinis-equi TaxID=585013 RepID=A0ABR3ERR6_9AGAR